MGILLSVGIAKIPPLIELEHRFFYRSAVDERVLERAPEEDFIIRSFPLIRKEPPAQTTFLVDDTPAVTDWMLALHHLRKTNPKNVTVSSLLSWGDANELELRALEHEVTSLPSSALGYDLQFTSIAQPFPPFLRPSTLHQITGDASLIPEVNAIVTLPSVSAGLHGFRILKNAQPLLAPNNLTIPLLARWDGNIIPSLELAALISRSRTPLSQIQILLGTHIRLSGSGHHLIIPIDPSGRTIIPRSDQTTTPEFLSFSQLYSSPGSPKVNDHIVLQEASAPIHLQQLSQSLTHLSSTITGEAKIIRRLSFWFEIPILILFAALLPLRKTISITGTFLIAALPPLASFYHLAWLLWLPLLAILLTFLLLRAFLKASPAQGSKALTA